MYIVKRSLENPLITPRASTPAEARGTFNGCPVAQ